MAEAAAAATIAARRANSRKAVLEEALAVLATAEATPAPDPARPAAPNPAIPAEPLSPREREVLALVAEGRSNKAIAAALSVSPNTVKTHVASLLHKLDAENRVQLAAIAVRDGAGHS